MPCLCCYRLNHNMLHMEQVAATLPGSAKMSQIQSWIVEKTFSHSNNQISTCLATCMPLGMLNCQSQVTTVSYGLMKTCIKDECKTFKMWSNKPLKLKNQQYFCLHSFFLKLWSDFNDKQPKCLFRGALHYCSALNYDITSFYHIT